MSPALELFSGGSDRSMIIFMLVKSPLFLMWFLELRYLEEALGTRYCSWLMDQFITLFLWIIFWCCYIYNFYVLEFYACFFYWKYFDERYRGMVFSWFVWWNYDFEEVNRTPSPKQFSYSFINVVTKLHRIFAIELYLVFFTRIVDV